MDEVDTLVGGEAHDLTRFELREAVCGAVRGGEYELVWMGVPCSSFSVLHVRVGGRQLRSRRQPAGVRPVPREWQAYLEKHNGFVRLATRVARLAWAVGATFVIENPVDRGMRQSPHFSWWWRQHVPLWLMPDIRELVRGIQVEWVSFPMCAFGGAFQKWTALMVAGPRAPALRALRNLVCVHARHERRASGVGMSGELESAQAGAYPVLFCATVAGLLSLGGLCAAVAGFVRRWRLGKRLHWWRVRSAREKIGWW